MADATVEEIKVEPDTSVIPGDAASKFPTDEYDTKTFNFTKGEQQTVTALDVVDAVYKQQAKFLEEVNKIPSNLLTGFLNSSVLKRVGVKQSQDNGIYYDSLNGTVTVYIPKVMCEACEVRKATKELNGKHYCDDCFGLAEKVQSDTPASKPS